MSYNEALDAMNRAAVNQSKIPFTACQGVINAIMAHYMITSDYYPENAVDTFEWYTPGGTASAVCLDMLKQPHLLIAGSTGSGKSVLINSLIYTALFSAPSACGLILIDPKRVELAEYASLPHCVRYASEPDEIAATIAGTVDLMEDRYKVLKSKHLKEWQGGHIYVIIDEFADLMTTQKGLTLAPLCRLAQLGRAAHVHLILATQRPTRDIINGQIKVNIDARVALRCPTAQDSRNIINVKGAELLPRYGYGYYLTPETMTPQLIKIPYTEPAELAARVKWWTGQKTPRDKARDCRSGNNRRSLCQRHAHTV